MRNREKRFKRWLVEQWMFLEMHLLRICIMVEMNMLLRRLTIGEVSDII